MLNVIHVPRTGFLSHQVEPIAHDVLKEELLVSVASNVPDVDLEQHKMVLL